MDFQKVRNLIFNAVNMREKSPARLETRWPLSSVRQILRLFQVFLTEALIFIKPPEVYRQAYVYSWVNIVALFVVRLVHVNFT